MAQVKYQSRTVESSTDGVSTTFSYFGTREELLALQNAGRPGISAPDGRIKNSRLFQQEGDVWCLEMRFESDADGSSSVAPPTEYGERSASLKGAMLSLPLENHEDYLTNWNYYLAAAPGITAIPEWWSSAVGTSLPDNDAQNYAWIKTTGEMPVDRNGRWHTLKEPAQKGCDSYDVAVYTVTETIRCRTQNDAGDLVANKLNRIGAPENDFGITGGDWKCDDASVSWSGKYWLATLTWTRSGDDRGWNENFYTKAVN